MAWAAACCDRTNYPGLLPGAGPSDYLPNDGIVNTISMKGPRAKDIAEIEKIPIEAVPGSAQQRRISESARTSRSYWHFGTNRTMDHADQIGVFTNEDTVRSSKFARFFVSVKIANSMIENLILIHTNASLVQRSCHNIHLAGQTAEIVAVSKLQALQV